MKIIHTADLHLDSPLTAHLSQKEKQIRKAELLNSFKRLVEQAKKMEVQAILIAGDFFDAKETTRKTKEYVYQTIQNNPNISFYYLCGNHDENLRAFGDVVLPENLYTFSDAVTTYVLNENITISGVELTEKNYQSVYDTLSLPDNVVNIFMLHGQTQGSSNNYETLNLAKLRNKNISYLALGHYHTFQTGKLDEQSSFCYSGCLEPRGFDETGEKGFVLLEIDDAQNLTFEFVPFSKRNLWEVPVNITGIESLLDQEKSILTAVSEIADKDLVRVVLQGDVALDTRLDIEHLVAVFASRFFYFTIKNKTQLKYDAEELKYNVSVEGEFIRTVLHEEEDKEMQQQIITTGLDALYGKEV